MYVLMLPFDRSYFISIEIWWAHQNPFLILVVYSILSRIGNSNRSIHAKDFFILCRLWPISPYQKIVKYYTGVHKYSGQLILGVHV